DDADRQGQGVGLEQEPLELGQDGRSRQRLEYLVRSVHVMPSRGWRPPTAGPSVVSRAVRGGRPMIPLRPPRDPVRALLEGEMDQAFRDAMTSGYTLTEPSLIIGSAMHDGELFNDTRVQIALSMLNR